jgi:hypothetical protein
LPGWLPSAAASPGCQHGLFGSAPARLVSPEVGLVQVVEAVALESPFVAGSSMMRNMGCRWASASNAETPSFGVASQALRTKGFVLSLRRKRMATRARRLSLISSTRIVSVCRPACWGDVYQSLNALMLGISATITSTPARSRLHGSNVRCLSGPVCFLVCADDVDGRSCPAIGKATTARSPTRTRRHPGLGAHRSVFVARTYKPHIRAMRGRPPCRTVTWSCVGEAVKSNEACELAHGAIGRRASDPLRGTGPTASVSG